MGSEQEEIFDVCVVGSGFAGLAIALDLADRGLSICLIEGGGEDWSEESQELYEGTTATDPGMSYWGLENCRLRYFGGTSNHWAGLCIPFDETDFANDDWFDLPGWPISLSELVKQYDKTAKFIDIEGKSFDWQGKSTWESDRVRPVGYVRSPPTRLNEKFYSIVKNHKNIKLRLNMNLVDIKLSDNLETVSYFKCVENSLETKKFFAKYYVLACGAVENARILLSSNGQVAAGIGNHSDLVGRCFMEHYDTTIGRFVAGDNALWQQHKSFILKPTPSLIESSQIANCILSINSNSNPRSYGRLAVLRQYVREAVCSSRNLTELSRKVAEFECPGDGVITMMCEQSPNKASRVVLGTEKDKFGTPRVKLDWRISELDKHTIRTMALETAKELAQQDIARVQLRSSILDANEDIDVSGHCHQMGTTRMSTSSSAGVVNENCQVHFVENLFVAGSSVFPRGGANNPTMPLVQLAYRLADHLAHQLQK